MRGWRNRQTRWIQVPVPERAWGFNSPLAHQEHRSSCTDEKVGTMKMVSAFLLSRDLPPDLPP